MGIPDGSLGFVASEQSWCDELAVAAAYCARSGAGLTVASRRAEREATTLTAAHPGLAVVVDTAHWRSTDATVDSPTACHVGLGVPTVAEWAAEVLRGTRATAVLTPSAFVRLGDRPALRELLAATTDLDDGAVVTHVATDAAQLEGQHLRHFVKDLATAGDRRLAFTFAARRDPFARRERLVGLRALLELRPASWILNVDPLVGTDAQAHGAGWVGVGASSSRRRPTRPGDKDGGPPARDFPPGLFLRPLLELRSPNFYADWYANSPSPYCVTCDRRLDVFDAVPRDRAAIVAHTVHAIADLAAELQDQPASGRCEWLHGERVHAVVRHQALTTAGAPVKVDPTLRHLCALDEPGGPSPLVRPM